MLRLSAKIVIGDFTFPFLAEVEINSSWENLTDTARIVVPNKLRWEGKNIVAGEGGQIKRGDKVTIDLGYNDNLKRYFTGYISKIRPRAPLEIECEDEMYLLKQKTIKKYSSVQSSLKELLTGIGITNFQAADINLGAFRISNATQAAVLEELRKNHNVQSFFRDGVLYSGLAYYPDQQNKVIREFYFNIISDELEYKREDDIKVKVKGISILKDNTKIEVEEGDPDGDLKTLHFYNLSKPDLIEAVKREIPRLKAPGLTGSIETFGDVFIKHGDAVRLIDKKIQDRNGTYLVKRVITRFGPGSGFHNTIELDRSI